MTTKLPNGFASAVPPVHSQGISTDADRLREGEVRIPVYDGEMPAYQACPVTGESFPVVLVIQEIFGVHEYIRDICRRLGKPGYLTIAPELYWRHGNASRMTNISDIMSQMVSLVSTTRLCPILTLH